MQKFRFFCPLAREIDHPIILHGPPGIPLNRKRSVRSTDHDSYSVVKGSNAIFLDLFIASVKTLWCLAQVPEILLGRDRKSVV